MREKHQAILSDRIELLGPIKHEDVRDVSLSFRRRSPCYSMSSLQLLVRGHIFLNPSLTEAFGIGILEAACAGLFVVSTRVGGVPEILPDGMIAFCEPISDGEYMSSTRFVSRADIDTDLVRALDVGIRHVRSRQHDPLWTHRQVRQMFSWTDVAERTERVYSDVLDEEQPSFVERLEK